jgi:hypothetical protein
MISNPAPDVLHALLAMHHFHEPAGSNETNDPADWNVASYESHPIDSIEPIDVEPNDYRAAALAHLQLMYAVDEFITAAPDARLAVVSIAICLGWPSTRGLTGPEIAKQLGCSPVTIARACDRFRELANLDSAGGVRLVRPGGAGNGNKPAAVRA